MGGVVAWFHTAAAAAANGAAHACVVVVVFARIVQTCTQKYCEKNHLCVTLRRRLRGGSYLCEKKKYWEECMLVRPFTPVQSRQR